MKQVGEAMEGRSQNLLGIAAWGIVYNRNELDKNKDLISYKVETSMVLEKEACLDHNHGYFVLFDDGSTEKFGREIDFRSRLEQRIMERGRALNRFIILNCFLKFTIKISVLDLEKKAVFLFQKERIFHLNAAFRYDSI